MWFGRFGLSVWFGRCSLVGVVRSVQFGRCSSVGVVRSVRSVGVVRSVQLGQCGSVGAVRSVQFGQCGSVGAVQLVWFAEEWGERLHAVAELLCRHSAPEQVVPDDPRPGSELPTLERADVLELVT